MTEVENNVNVTLTVTEKLRENLREFIDLTEQIKNVKKDLKIINERKAELETDLCEYMVENDIPAFNTPNGKISVYQTKSVKPINKDFVYETFFSSGKIEERLAKELSELVFTASRPSVPIQKIKVNNVTKRR